MRLHTLTCLLLASVSGCGATQAEPESSATNEEATPIAQADQLRRVHPAEVMTLPRPQGTDRYHEVKSGESLSVIAKKYKTTVGALVKANGLEDGNFLLPGQLIYIP